MRMSTRRRILLICIAGGGRGKSARQTTSQDAACIRPPDRPIVSVAALLRLARWCQGRRRDTGGPLPCEATANDQFPPAHGRPDAPRAPRPPLAGAAGDGPARDAHGPRPDVTRALRPPPDGPEVAHEGR